LLLPGPGSGDDGSSEHHRREERRRREGRPHLFEDHGELDGSEAGAAVGFGQGDPRPAQFGQLLPKAVGKAARVFHLEANGTHRTFASEKVAGALLEPSLFFVQLCVHVGPAI